MSCPSPLPPVPRLSAPARLRFAGAVSLAGLFVAVMILSSGASAVPLLPPPLVFCLGAMLGAGLAGVAAAGAFGRRGWWGIGASAAAALAMTSLGAEIGAFAVLFALDERGVQLVPGLGVLTLAMSLDAPGPVVGWLASMSALHVVALRLRRA